MAARKSCTHLTWAEAKQKSGIGGGGDGKIKKKNKEHLRKLDHGQVLAAKIIAKQGGGGAVQDRKLQKAHRKLEEKAAALAAQREQERALKRLESLQEVQRFQQAQEKLQQLMDQLRENDTNDLPTSGSEWSAIDWDNINHDDDETLTKLVECRQMQLDEVMALQAMIPEEDFIISTASELSKLQEYLERLNEGDVAAREFVAKHPPISFYIRLQIDDHRADQVDSNLNALLLVRVTLPPLYLNPDGDSQIPIWEFPHVMVTDKDELCSADKPLESLAWLDTVRVQESLSRLAAEELLPYPAVYETTVTWLSEHVFDVFQWHPHLQATQKQREGTA